MLRLSSIGLTVFLSACISHGKMNDVVIKDPAKTATATVFRQDEVIGYLNTFTVTHGNNDIYKIGSGKNVEFQISEGEQVIGVKCFGGMLPITHHDQITFSAKANTHYYFLIRVRPEKLGDFSCARLKQISDIDAQKWLQITRNQ